MSTSTSNPPNGPAATRVSEDPIDERKALPLPTFHSFQDPVRGETARPHSVASSSHNFADENHDHDHRHLSERFSFGSSIQSDGSKGKEKERGRRKENLSAPYQIPRNSGGFLLEPITNAKGGSRLSVTASRSDSRRKRDSTDSELSISKRRSRNNANLNPSFKSSPLASELRDEAVVHNKSAGGALIPGTDFRRSLSSSQQEPQTNGSATSRSRDDEAQSSRGASVGYDQDSVQIVQMALNLSEGRRRLASGRRYVSLDQGERRVVSTASTVDPRSTVKRKSIAPFLATSRQSSRTGSPKAKQSSRRLESKAPAMDDDLIDFDINLPDQISPATMARVEKAKLYFELAHEHRRLLSHLPPIRRPGAPAPSSGAEAMQKAYNPLQYVRNRKLRIWEKTSLDSEADGWHDIEKVRAWVDAVISSHSETQHDPLECVRLPPLDQKPAASDDQEQDGSPVEAKSAASPRIQDPYFSKPTRPRSDWVTHPADLLADAYWLEQGLNKTKIQDRDNNLIYPPNTHFRFSGWRNETPVEIPSTLRQQHSPTQQDVESGGPDEVPPSALPELPTFKSAHHKHTHRSKFRGSLPAKESSSSRERSRIRHKLFHDSESDGSESSSSEHNSTDRGRRRLRRKRLHSPLGKGTDAHRSDSPSKHSPHVNDSSQPSSTLNSKRSSVDHSALTKMLKIENLKKASPLSRSRHRDELSRPTSIKIPTRSSLDQEQPRRVSSEYDTTTAQNSPDVPQWPSIAINLSPPPSRGSSPARKHMSSILHPFHSKQDSKDVEHISATDFAHAPQAQPNQSAGETKHQSESNGSRGTSPMTRSLSPFSKPGTESTHTDDFGGLLSGDSKSTSISKVTTRSAGTGGSDHFKFRGIFKGGRIAELVGNEVSRVGDFIWKRDPPPPDHRHHMSISDSSLRSYRGSDSEKETGINGIVIKTPPPMRPLSRSSTVSSTKSERLLPTTSRISPMENGRPQYNNPNLPSFVSPFQRDKEQQQRKQALSPGTDGIRSDSTDHISRLAVQHRSSSRSPRLARLSLPKLDTGNTISPSELERKQSYGFGAAIDLSRSRDASELLNTALGSTTGLTGLHGSRSAGDLTRVPTTSEESESTGTSWRDIGRAEALLYSSAVKAREIGRRSEEEMPELPKFFLGTLNPVEKDLCMTQRQRCKRREYYIMAAKNIMRNLDQHSAVFNEKLQLFSSEVAPRLHMQLQQLEDMIENRMTPQIRTTADHAGELGMKLTTTSTLAVKELNDSIEKAMRNRRRGPIRLLRLLLFAGIEWTVVSLLWLIWAIVSIVRLVTGTFRTIGCVVKWLLWID
ncbi:hypothetical protein PV08_01316 [Exophiala spinifera]|uniref:REJ domain-containing protein n=1 Tax=Exophiala spinifera TaxID=91928 RepID=A0A0D2BP83_9EURO|nr:uncharacterized protein PV08_01316 [Exophiala spinifera]KIW20738.1 hypothetical protein PV08_01316 [Exophiala spinifera]